MEILQNIPFELNKRALLSRLHAEEEGEMAEEILALADQVVPVINPKAIYDVCYIDSRGDETITLNGTTFTSRVLRINLDTVERVFPYISTCGAEVDALGLAEDDFVVGFWIDAIKELALGAISRHLRTHVKERYLLDKMSNMNPGSGDADVWPIAQQQELFGLFGDVEALIGVRLTDSCLMIPNKSVSGIFFPTEVDFQSCQVCQREDCPGRHAPYDPELAETRYGHGALSDPEECES